MKINELLIREDERLQNRFEGRLQLLLIYYFLSFSLLSLHIFLANGSFLQYLLMNFENRKLSLFLSCILLDFFRVPWQVREFITLWLK
jgi:hypothetical protein